MSRSEKSVTDNYENARELYELLGVSTDEILKKIEKIQISLHCWQGDDGKGFEVREEAVSGGGILATGNYPGRARNGEELRKDYEMALSLIPGKHRVNLHAIYAETNGKRVERDQLTPEHFKDWVYWAKSKDIKLDFNPTFYAHEKADAGFTLSSKNETIRKFWVEHGKRSREIATFFGKELGSPSVNNVWIPDGSKDLPANRLVHREILLKSLDELFTDKYDKHHLIDAVECKLFGIGFESYVVGSHEFYIGYGITRDIAICLDMGHFHPTESIADKISALLLYSKSLLLHVSRGVRWDSDHVVILNDDLLALSQEIKRCDAFERVHIALDFFDASINRITAWVTGTRATLKSILIALLEPSELLKQAEEEGNNGQRLALMEEFKTLPFGAVWDKYCMDMHTPVGVDWLNNINEYEKDVLSRRV